MEQTETIADGGEVIVPQKETNFSKPLIIGLIISCVFVLALGLGLGLALFARPKTPTPTPIPIQNPPMFEPAKPKEPSKLATDSAVLKLKNDVSALADELNRLDLTEPLLSPPNLDLEIRIE